MMYYCGYILQSFQEIHPAVVLHTIINEEMSDVMGLTKLDLSMIVFVLWYDPPKTPLLQILALEMSLYCLKSWYQGLSFKKPNILLFSLSLVEIKMWIYKWMSTGIFQTQFNLLYHLGGVNLQIYLVVFHI